MAVKKNNKTKAKSSKTKAKKTPRAIATNSGIRTVSKKKKKKKKKNKNTAAAAGASSASSVFTSQLANFGTLIVFSVSANKILTFNNMKREQAGRWQTHPILSKAPKSEFLGPDLAQVTMEVKLSAEHGVKPLSTLQAIEAAVRTGQVENLVIGGKIYGPDSHKWYIESVSETWDEVFNMGELVRATMQLTFREYV